MKNEINRALGAKKNESEKQSWTKVLLEVIIKIHTLGFYHIEKHKKQ